jgi:EAL domain-containing protein (putative c-di-GMP-specific phosphodiesterase class I)
MRRLENEPIAIQEIIDRGLISPHFQPLVSMKKTAVVGVEGLSRGIDPRNGKLIPAPLIFREAAAKGLSRELDLLCRRKILEDFRRLQARFPQIILSLNIDASAIEKRIWSGYLKTQVAEAGISPSSVVIEIVESVVGDIEELEKFVESYRESGFLIALDDVGAGHSNLNRIPLIKPDVLKIDRYLVMDIQEDFYKQEVIKSLVSMARHLGTVLIAEGVETQAEVSTLLEMGVDIIQGFYFSKPRLLREFECDSVREKIDELGLSFRLDQLLKVEEKRINVKKYFSLVSEVQGALTRVTVDEFENQLVQAASVFPSVECLYVLDENGRQITEMVLNTAHKPGRNSPLFHPSPKGSDHRIRDYYYFLMSGELNKNSYVTKPYVSMGSGNLCVTIGSLFRDSLDRRYILCLDIHTSGFGARVLEPAAKA